MGQGAAGLSRQILLTGGILTRAQTLAGDRTEVIK